MTFVLGCQVCNIPTQNAKCATYLYRFWVSLQTEGRRNGVSSVFPPHWIFRSQTCQFLDNTWGHVEEQSSVWTPEFLSPKKYRFLGFYTAVNTRGLTLEVEGICGEFLKKFLMICSPSFRHVLEVNQAIFLSYLNECLMFNDLFTKYQAFLLCESGQFLYLP